jgi:hypothetical protein
MAIAGEETIEAGKGISGLGGCGAGDGASARPYDEERLSRLPGWRLSPGAKRRRPGASIGAMSNFKEMVLNWRRNKAGEHLIFC